MRSIATPENKKILGSDNLKNLFINHTNHASSNWSPEQRTAAEIYGEIVDFPFPNIDAHFDENKISELVEENAKKIIEMNPAAVLCHGEYSYTYAMINYLKKNNVLVIAATSERVVEEIVTEDGATQRTSVFRFVRFRQYQ